MVTNILYLMKRHEDVIDYDALIIRVMAADVMVMSNASAIWIFMRTMIQGGAKKIVVDLHGLEYIDSSGINVLIESAKLIRQYKGDIVLLNVPERILTLFKPINLNRFINIFNTEDEVINFFKLI
ncbi:MAG: hypothetical protein A2176_12360 [Spirochaetes bacterium RBG_13_51_14]|nr:MAG: hypothetical protein A2176_12360 [Spirochaetes bacterium RBG_13_51_14]